MTTTMGGRARPSQALSVCLWVVQGLLGILFAGTGFWKLLTPIPQSPP
ncbi:MAG: hypothetical protein QM820_36620 [Minicystis sp.]